MLKQVQHDAKYRHICELVNVIKQTHYPQTPSSKRQDPQTTPNKNIIRNRLLANAFEQTSRPANAITRKRHAVLMQIRIISASLIQMLKQSYCIFTVLCC